MIYIVYKTTNNITNKYYIGVHCQCNLEFDGYLGSGTILKKAIKKYGPNSFTREIMFHYDNAIAAFAKEKELVTPELVESDVCYNTSGGGFGSSYRSIETREKLRVCNIGKPGFPGELNPAKRPEVRAKIGNARRGKHYPKLSEAKSGSNNPFFGKKRPELALSMKEFYKTEKGIEYKLQLSEAWKQNNLSKGRVPWNKGIKCSDETKTKIGLANKNRIPSLETRNKMSIAHRSRKCQTPK